MADNSTLWEKGTSAMEVIKSMSEAGYVPADMLAILMIATGIVKAQLPPVPRKRIKPAK